MDEALYPGLGAGGEGVPGTLEVAALEVIPRAFVTGGSGFIGGRLVRRLVSEGRQVRALARSEQAAERVAELGAEPVRGELGDQASLAAGAAVAIVADVSLAGVKSVLITGASTGIGRASALRLDGAGWRVFAGVRRQEDAESLRADASPRLTPLMIDVTDADQIAAAARGVAGTIGEAGLDGLVNNAGIAVPSPLETIPIDDFRQQIEVNLTGQVAVTQALLPSLRQARGRVVFISSIGGRIAFPLTGAYHAAKFGIEAVGDFFRQELRPWGISVSIVEPGSIATPIWDRGEQRADEIGERTPEREALYGKAVSSYRKVVKATAKRGIPPEKAAAAIEHALEARRPQARYLVGLDAKVQARLKPIIPTRFFDRIVARAMGL
jgi:NAD(P)-dependent dehydrogenase (short-subunit alcohol dehydrogenase family)